MKTSASSKPLTKSIAQTLRVMEDEKYKAVSFDLFDTLVRRNLSKPEHLFWLMEAALADHGYDPRWVKDFGNARATAGTRAIHHAGLYGKDDFGLDVIYQLISTILPASAPYLPDIMKIEFDLEASFLEPYPDGVLRSLPPLGGRRPIEGKGVFVQGAPRTGGSRRRRPPAHRRQPACGHRGRPIVRHRRDAGPPVDTRRGWRAARDRRRAPALPRLGGDRALPSPSDRRPVAGIGRKRHRSRGFPGLHVLRPPARLHRQMADRENEA